MQELKSVFGKTFITISVDIENRWIHTNWAGYLTQDNIKAGALAYINAVRESGYSCVLNDSREVLGSWEHSLDWVLNEWAPQAAAAGIRHFALITSPESLAESTASNFLTNIKAFEVRLFAEKPSAEAWLQQHAQGK